MSEVIIAIITAVATFIALWLTYTGWKLKELRKDEILAWSLDCIDVMQRTQVLLAEAADNGDSSYRTEPFLELKMRSSVQVERGRMFFSNVQDSFGHDKPNAYKGLRPVILDCLVANCQICEIAIAETGRDFDLLKTLSLNYTRDFVSYAQEEVGRSRKSKSGAEMAGSHIDIKREMITNGGKLPVAN